jgi:hypothetical protein
MVRASSFPVLVFVFLISAFSVAHADVTRICKASIEVRVLASPQHNWSNEYIARLEGRGACANSVWANRCRERARDAIDDCRKALWDNRFTNAIPAACRSGTDTRPGARLTWDGIATFPQSDRIFSRVIHSACCRQKPNASAVTVEVHGTIWGGEKCGSRVGIGHYQSDYKMAGPFGIDCNYWAKGICR